MEILLTTLDLYITSALMVVAFFTALMHTFREFSYTSEKTRDRMYIASLWFLITCYLAGDVVGLLS